MHRSKPISSSSDPQECFASNPAHVVPPIVPLPQSQWPAEPFTWEPAIVPFGAIGALILLEALFLFGHGWADALFGSGAVPGAGQALSSPPHWYWNHFPFMGGLGIVAMLAADGYRTRARARDATERARADARLDAWYGAVVLYGSWILVAGAEAGGDDLLAMIVLVYGPTLAICVPLLGWAAVQIRNRACARCLLAGFAILNALFQAVYLHPGAGWSKHGIDETRCMLMSSMLVFLVVGAWTVVVEWKAWESERRLEA